MSQPTPLQACEDILREDIRYNIEHKILPSEIEVANRLLSRRTELLDAYEELHSKLAPHPPALQVFLSLVLRTAAHWSPAKIAKARAERDLLVELNRRIAACADELADLLEQRTAESKSFTSNTHHSVLEVIAFAAEQNHLFRSYVRPTLEQMEHFESRYWPSIADFVRQVGTNAFQAELQATDPLTAAATRSSRPSNADFVKALLVAIEENGAREYGQLPFKFRATDATLATLANCALDLGPDAVKDGAYIKTIRHREGSR